MNEISKIPLNRTAGSITPRTPPIYRSPHKKKKKKYKPEWQMPSLNSVPLRFASAFAHFSPYVFSLKYEPYTTTPYVPKNYFKI